MLSVLVLLSLVSSPLTASADTLAGSPGLSLAWNRNPEADVVGYRVYFGTASRRYTNSVFVGNVTSNVTSGLANGVPYFFAVTALDATGLESDYSPEVVYTPGHGKVKVRMANRQAVLTMTGPVGQAYDFLATTNWTSWSVLGSATAGASGEASFTDTAATGHRVRYYRARQKP